MIHGQLPGDPARHTHPIWTSLFYVSVFLYINFITSRKGWEPRFKRLINLLFYSMSNRWLKKCNELIITQYYNPIGAGFDRKSKTVLWILIVQTSTSDGRSYWFWFIFQFKGPLSVLFNKALKQEMRKSSSC